MCLSSFENFIFNQVEAVTIFMLEMDFLIAKYAQISLPFKKEKSAKCCEFTSE